MRKSFFFLSFFLYNGMLFCQYVSPGDTLVENKLHHWQNIKFGLLMHWGTYSQWGIVESWSICPDENIKRTGPYAENYFEYLKAYENLQTTFNPVNFNPDKWATAARDAGMKYVVFTTKHHDGFCMFDTKETDYKITSPKTPFSASPKADVTKEIFNSFRKQGFMIGAYFSKPDWHSPYYWWPYFPPKNHNVNYGLSKYPERWNKFKSFVYNQINELTTGYGNVDILWLDGGWVRPDTAHPDNNQDLDMPRIAAMARKNQPGIIIVDRTVGGKYENYETPEQTIPDKPLEYPWESCITMGNSWSYSPNDVYKSSGKLIHMLIEIVSRGGNLLLNIGPSPEGDWSDTVYSRLEEIGAWMHIYGNAIYDSKPVAPYQNNNIVYTQSEDRKTKYIFILSNENNDAVTLPRSLQLPDGFASGQNRISIMGTKKKLKWNIKSGTIAFPKRIPQNIFDKYAVVLKIE